MKEFFRSLLASLVALGLFAAACVVVLVGIVASMGPSKPEVPSRSVLILDLNTNFTDAYQDQGPAELIQKAAGQGQAESVPLDQVIQSLDRAAHDPALCGLFITGVIRPDGVGSGPAALKELREAVARFRKESGKPVIAYNQYWTKREYYVCSGATRIYMNPMGVLDASGYASEITFYGKAFKKYGIDVQVTRVGKYKSAVEPYVLDHMSDPNREQLQSLLGDIWSDWKQCVAQDRKLDPAKLQAIADEQGSLTSPEALKAGLVDKLAPFDEVLDELKGMTGRKAGDRDYPKIDLATYVKAGPDVTGGRSRVALLFAEGTIVDGAGTDGSVGGDSLSQEIRRLRLDKGVKAIVLRVNSPGGSAMASEVILRELVLARKEKPVVVSMGHLAASGGYWISTYGDRIFAEPNTLTGSIGVFGLMPNLKGLANDHGITWDAVQTARLGSPLTISRPKSEAELARAQAEVDWIYDQFLTRVSESRKLSRGKVEEIAQGRVWSGAAALKLGLVDELGGLKDAVRCAAKLAKVENDYRVEGPGQPRSPLEKILSALGGSRRDYTAVQAGAVKNEVRKVLHVFDCFNDPANVYALMPYEVTLK